MPDPIITLPLVLSAAASGAAEALVSRTAERKPGLLQQARFALPQAQHAWRQSGVMRHQSRQGMPGTGNDQFIALHDLLQIARQMRFGFMNIDGWHVYASVNQVGLSLIRLWQQGKLH